MSDPNVAAYTFPSGHLSHLSPSQKGAFEQFKTLCTERKAYIPGKGDQLPSHSDATLLRFLRARKFQQQGAYEQFAGTEKWRDENRLKELYEQIDVQEYEDTRRLYPQWVGRRDKRGMPLYVFEVGTLDPKDISKYENAKSLQGSITNGRKAPAKMLRLFALYENLMTFVCPWSTAVTSRPHTETPLTQGNNIIDVTGCGLKTFWNLQSHLQDSSSLATAHYPETLDKIFIVGAPSVFPTVWSWIKRFLDPIVVSKVNICPSGAVFSTLSQYIDEENIPTQYGGKLEWKWGDLPNLDTEMTEGMEWGPAAVEAGRSAEGAEGQEVQRDGGEPESKGGRKGLPIGPIRWEEGEDGDMVMMSLGSKDGKPQREVIGTLKGRKWRDVFYMVDTEGASAGAPQAAEKGSQGDEKAAPRAAEAEAGQAAAPEIQVKAVQTAPGPPVGDTYSSTPPPGGEKST